VAASVSCRKDSTNVVRLARLPDDRHLIVEIILAKCGSEGKVADDLGSAHLTEPTSPRGLADPKHLEANLSGREPTAPGARRETYSLIASQLWALVHGCTIFAKSELPPRQRVACENVLLCRASQAWQVATLTGELQGPTGTFMRWARAQYTVRCRARVTILACS
jgi:hypothetical protein